LPSVSALTIGAAAMALGGLLQACVAAPRIYVHRALLWANRRTVATSAIAVAIYPLAFYSSMRLAGVAVGTVVSIGTAPLFGALAEYLSGRGVRSQRWIAGVTMGLAGVVVLAIASVGESHSNATDHRALLGVALGFVAGATYAFYTWGAARTMRQGCPSRSVMGAVFGAAAILLLPVLLVTGGSIAGSAHALAVVAYLGLVPMFMGYVMFGKGLATTLASTATTLTLIEPGVAALLAAVVLREHLSAMGWTGIALLFASLLVISRPDNSTMSADGEPVLNQRLDPNTPAPLTSPSSAARPQPCHAIEAKASSCSSYP
jgi:drug/metabolite transporter, DME family